MFDQIFSALTPALGAFMPGGSGGPSGAGNPANFLAPLTNLLGGGGSSGNSNPLSNLIPGMGQSPGGADPLTSMLQQLTGGGAGGQNPLSNLVPGAGSAGGLQSLISGVLGGGNNNNGLFGISPTGGGWTPQVSAVCNVRPARGGF